MSIGGPCLWMSSLSSPVASPLSAVTSHLSAVARHGERVSSTPRIASPLLVSPRNREPISRILSSSTEMQRPGVAAENALPTPLSISASMAGPGSYREGEISSREAVNPRFGEGREEPLPRMRLEIPGGGNTIYPMPQPQVGFGRPAESTSTSQSTLGANEDHDKDSTISPTEEKGEMSGDDESNRSPSLEKKKMKRFR